MQKNISETSQQLRQPLIFFTGPFPPPVHGMAVATGLLAAALGERFHVRRFNIAARRLTGLKILDIPARMLRALWTLASFAWLSFRRRPEVVVIALSVGYAKVFDLACIAIGLLASRPIYITHHSFVVFNRVAPDRLIKIALPLLRRCKHITLCGRMKLELISAWNIEDANVAVLSNAALVRIPATNLEAGSPSIQSVRCGAYHLGFIANLCAEKGLWTFLDTVDRLQAIGHTVVATIAGPVEPADALLEKELKQRLHAMKNVSWLGAVHGRERTHFYQELDLLVFPTVYPNESEPLVILEALAHGVPVVTTPRGCIASSLADGNAVRAFPEASFVDDAVAAIDADLQAIKPQSEREALAKQHYHQLQEIGDKQLKMLIESMFCLQKKHSSRH
ncbi:glycosyltransferase family 4 protein [Nitrosomonas oligotropha]|uniref:glycosyltransferase family 4 protein n=1 Tax=Nitrosomonas oligotropha TaxID=42354 RepID=UPI00136B3FDB|nr:glycosyltransferase family 4 protein [Nitrosomonas oligotropha]MXS82185.1 glycosyltransferase [Nitrosomonas oligotropha]